MCFACDTVSLSPRVVSTALPFVCFLDGLFLDLAGQTCTLDCAAFYLGCCLLRNVTLLRKPPRKAGAERALSGRGTTHCIWISASNDACDLPLGDSSSWLSSCWTRWDALRDPASKLARTSLKPFLGHVGSTLSTTWGLVRMGLKTRTDVLVSYHSAYS